MTIIRSLASLRPIALLALAAALFASACSDDDPGSGGVTPLPTTSGNAGTGGAPPLLDAGADSRPNEQADADAAPQQTQDSGSDATDGNTAWQALCLDRAGSPIAYDFSRGLAGEYAFELAMSCDLGGYMTALVEADPVNLTKVDEYVAELTEWYRGTVLLCAEEGSTATPDRFELVPRTESAGMSTPDFEGAIALFMGVVDRHDEAPDGVSARDKHEIRERLKSFKQKAVKSQEPVFTRRSNAPDCVPAPGDGGAALE
jgi:hypothetical protein